MGGGRERGEKVTERKKTRGNGDHWRVGVDGNYIYIIRPAPRRAFHVILGYVKTNG